MRSIYTLYGVGTSNLASVRRKYARSRLCCPVGLIGNQKSVCHNPTFFTHYTNSPPEALPTAILVHPSGFVSDSFIRPLPAHHLVWMSLSNTTLDHSEIHNLASPYATPTRLSKRSSIRP